MHEIPKFIYENYYFFCILFKSYKNTIDAVKIKFNHVVLEALWHMSPFAVARAGSPTDRWRCCYVPLLQISPFPLWVLLCFSVELGAESSSALCEWPISTKEACWWTAAQSVQKPRERNISSRTALLQVRTCSLCSVVTFFAEGVCLNSEARELMYSIHAYLILCMKIHFTKQLAFTGNQRSTMERLAPLYVPCYHALFPHLPPTFTSFQATVLVIGASLSRQFCWKTL
jgi:hypothetical protein